MHHTLLWDRPTELLLVQSDDFRVYQCISFLWAVDQERVTCYLSTGIVNIQNLFFVWM
jgi:hypothetical protein